MGRNRQLPDIIVLVIDVLLHNARNICVQRVSEWRVVLVITFADSPSARRMSWRRADLGHWLPTKGRRVGKHNGTFNATFVDATLDVEEPFHAPRVAP
jgi:hypothetical protein